MLNFECEHLDVVKYLVEQGADMHVSDDLALRWKKMYGIKEYEDILNAYKQVSFDREGTSLEYDYDILDAGRDLVRIHK